MNPIFVTDNKTLINSSEWSVDLSFSENGKDKNIKGVLDNAHETIDEMGMSVINDAPMVKVNEEDIVGDGLLVDTSLTVGGVNYKVKSCVRQNNGFINIYLNR